MDAAIHGARLQGSRRLLLGVYAKNHRALRFYERNGFRQVGVRTFTVGTLVCDDFVLGLTL
jgi:ribosomal protein S18 acetylase RimI-like enzyme